MISQVEDFGVQDASSTKGNDPLKSFDNNEFRKNVTNVGSSPNATGMAFNKVTLPNIPEDRGGVKPRFTLGGGVSGKDTKLLKDTVSKVQELEK